MNALDALLRPLNPESGWYWGGTPRDWAAMTPIERVQGETLAIATGGKPPLSVVRVGLLVAGAGALVWFATGRRTRRNPRAGRSAGGRFVASSGVTSLTTKREAARLRRQGWDLVRPDGGELTDAELVRAVRKVRLQLKKDARALVRRLR